MLMIFRPRLYRKVRHVMPITAQRVRDSMIERASPKVKPRARALRAPNIAGKGVKRAIF